jgi:hypothetical protein
MTGRRRGLLPFEVIKMRTEEELAACGASGAQGSKFAVSESTVGHY